MQKLSMKIKVQKIRQKKLHLTQINKLNALNVIKRGTQHRNVGLEEIIIEDEVEVFHRGNYYNYQQSHLTQDDKINFIAYNEEDIQCNSAKIIEDFIEFIIDSGATENLIREDFEKYIHNIQKLKKQVNIKIANGDILQTNKKGTITVYSHGQEINIEVLIVPKIFHNIISVKRLIKKNFKVIFSKLNVKITNNKYTWLCKGRN